MLSGVVLTKLVTGLAGGKNGHHSHTKVPHSTRSSALEMNSVKW